MSSFYGMKILYKDSITLVSKYVFCMIFSKLLESLKAKASKGFKKNLRDNFGVFIFDNRKKLNIDL